MNKILFLMSALAFASCVQQPAAPAPAVAPAAPVAAPAPAPAAPVRPAPKPKPKPAVKSVQPAPQPKAAEAVKPVAVPAPLKPLPHTYSSTIPESDKVQTKRSMGGGGVYPR